jgi:predicted nucleic-acid-binding protein
VIGLDTNVVIRYLTQDDPKQSPIATRLMETSLSTDDPGFVSLVVLAEVVWVLVSLYSVDRAGVAEVVTGLRSHRLYNLADAVHIKQSASQVRGIRMSAARFISLHRSEPAQGCERQC